MEVQTKLTQVRITSKVMQSLSKMFKATGLILRDYELIDTYNQVSGYQFFEDDRSMQKVLTHLRNFPALSSVKTSTFEKHIYRIGNITVSASIFFSGENRGSFLVLAPES